MKIDTTRPRSGARWKLICAGAAFVFVILSAITAHAQIGSDLLPPLPVSTELPNTDPTPESSPTPEGTPTGLPIGGVTSPLPTALPTLPKSDPLGDPLGLLGGDGDPGPTGNQNNNNSTTNPDTVSDPAPPGGGGTGTTPGSSGGTNGGTSTVTVPGADAPSLRYGLLPGGSYGAVARRAAVNAAGRAIDLAGPLAPPLIIAAAMLLFLAALGRGNDRFGKFEHVTLKRAYRL